MLAEEFRKTFCVPIRFFRLIDIFKIHIECVSNNTMREIVGIFRNVRKRQSYEWFCCCIEEERQPSFPGVANIEEMVADHKRHMHSCSVFSTQEQLVNGTYPTWISFPMRGLGSLRATIVPLLVGQSSRIVKLLISDLIGLFYLYVFPLVPSHLSGEIRLAVSGLLASGMDREKSRKKREEITLLLLLPCLSLFSG